MRRWLWLAGVLFCLGGAGHAFAQPSAGEANARADDWVLQDLDNAPPGSELQADFGSHKDAPVALTSAGTRGIASWYGRQFHGRRTASGERFNMYALTAAHKTLPLMSYVRVSNPANGKSIVVRITDRGPHANNRMIDLSYGAAQELEIKGLGEVALDTVDRAEYEAQADQTPLERDLREASFVLLPSRRPIKRTVTPKPVRR